MLNSEHLSLVNKIGDKTEFTITRVHCIWTFIQLFYLDFYFLFLFGLLFSLFYQDFYFFLGLFSLFRPFYFPFRTNRDLILDFFQVFILTFISFFYLDFRFPFLLGLLFLFYTFISLFALISICSWISSKFLTNF